MGLLVYWGWEQKLREAPFSNMLGVFGQKFNFWVVNTCHFTIFLSFFVIVQFQFFIVSNFSETIWILSFLSDICDVTLACYDGGCCNVLRIEYPDSWNFKEGKFWGFEYVKSWEFQIDLKLSKFRMLESSNQNNSLRIWASYILKFQDWGSWLLNF